MKKLIGPLQLRSEFLGEQIQIDVGWLANELVTHHSYLIAFMPRAAGSMLILAYEICKDQPSKDRVPLWEFLRHCRNAAAHGGNFNFRGKEPTRLAAWGRFNVDRTLQGTLLFKKPGSGGLLSPGDPIRLLSDIEQEYPGLTWVEPAP